MRFWKVSHTDDNIVKTIPVHTDPWYKLKTLYYACHACWRCQFVKKHCTHAHIPVDWKRNAHARDLTVFTNSRFWSYKFGVDNDIFKKTCSLKHIFKCLCFQAPKMQLKMDGQMVENCHVNSPPLDWHTCGGTLLLQQSVGTRS